MATYGVDAYGTGLYGGVLPSTFHSGGPFDPSGAAYPKIGISYPAYGQVLLNLSGPTTGVARYRVTRSYTGFPMTPNTATVVADSATPITSVQDTPTPGQYAHYTLWVSPFLPTWVAATAYVPHVNDNVYWSGRNWSARQVTQFNDPTSSPAFWEPSSALAPWVIVSLGVALPPVNWGNTDDIVALVPEPYNDPTTTAMESFMSTFGYELDSLRTYYGVNAKIADVRQATDKRALAAAQQVGVRQPSPDGRLLRTQATTGSKTARGRGTKASLLSALSSATGWGFDLVDSTDISLHDQAATIGTRELLPWNATTQYRAGDYVTISYSNQNHQVKCIADAYGAAMSPISGGYSTWWTFQGSTIDATLLHNSTTGGVSVWDNYQSAGTPSNATNMTAVRADQNAGAYLSSDNWLQITNSSGIDGTICGARMAPLNGLTGGALRDALVRNAVVLPRLGSVWVGSAPYVVGDRVVYLGRVFAALVANSNVLPPPRASSSGTWQYVSSSRAKLSFSSTQSYGPGVNPYALFRHGCELYDELGNLLYGRVPSDVINPGGPLFSDFRTPVSDYSTVLMEFYPGLTRQWTATAASVWAARYDRLFIDPSVGGQPSMRTLRYLAGGVGGVAAADGSVALTFKSSPITGSHGVLFRWQDDNNFWAATRTKLVKMTAGVLSTVATYVTPCVDGDRIQVTFAGSNIIVKRYLAQAPSAFTGPQLVTLASVTDSFLNANVTRSYGIYENLSVV